MKIAHPDLVQHNAVQFKKSIVELAPGIWTAVGYTASTLHMIEGETTVTIIDTSESTSAAEAVLAAFRTKSAKPIARIIYTHSHRDHISGAAVFAEGQTIPILAHTAFNSDLIAKNISSTHPTHALNRRTLAQFGFGLAPQKRISLGCGPGDRPTDGMGAGHIPLTTFYNAHTTIDLDGVTAELIPAPRRDGRSLRGLAA